MKKTLFLIYFIILFPILLGFWVENLEKDMDKRSLWYDADSTFVMLETEEGMIGVYQGSVPVEHGYAKISSLIKEGHIEDTVNWETLKKLIITDLKTEIPDDTPCYIYNRREDNGYRYDTGS